MRILYLDCFAGVSGDMFVGALLDCGLDLTALEAELGKLELPGYRLGTTRVDRSGISATKFDVIIEGATHHHHDGHDETHEHEPHHEHRALSSIRRMIEQAGLRSAVRSRALDIFQRLGEAEAKIHNVPIEKVQFHEVGAIDSIVDIVSAAICLDLLNIERVLSSPLHVGSGTFQCAHGTYPVPGPATAELLRGVPVYSGVIEGELVTPTGAAIVSSIVESFGPLKGMRIEATGYGAGTREYPHFPNVLRVFLGSDEISTSPDDVVVIESNIDDLNPQVFGYVLDRLFAEGALDVFYTPVHMKKNRPGILLTVLGRPDDRQRLASVLFAETTTLGLRYRVEQRQVLHRSQVLVMTPFGKIRMKVAHDDAGRRVNHAPEFEDCVSAARQHQVALREVQLAATTAYLALEAE